MLRIVAADDLPPPGEGGSLREKIAPERFSDVTRGLSSRWKISEIRQLRRKCPEALTDRSIRTHI
jgi:hypothetical protein